MPKVYISPLICLPDQHHVVYQTITGYRSRSNHADAWKYRPLHYIALYQDEESFVYLLLKLGTFLDARVDYERTLLARASANGCAKSAAALLDEGADIDAVDTACDPPLFPAISHNARVVSHDELNYRLKCASPSR